MASSLLTLLLADTNSLAVATGGLGVLTAHAETPHVAETAVQADLRQANNVVAKACLEVVSSDLIVLASAGVLLSVKEPGLMKQVRITQISKIITGILKRRGSVITATMRSTSSGESSPALQQCENKRNRSYILPLAHINVGLPADQTGKAATNTLNGSQRVHGLLATVNVGVEDTKNVLERGCLQNDRLQMPYQNTPRVTDRRDSKD